VVVNVAVLGKASRQAARVAAIGAALPDLPIFVFYFVEKVYFRRSEAEIWRHDYFGSAWQPVIDGLHSFPLILLALLILWRAPWGRVLCASMVLHSLLDMPFHHDDAHRHFFPISDWRFVSPLSYWDPRYHGTLGALVELVALTASALVLFGQYSSRRLRTVVSLLCLLQAGGYVFFWLG
jgi:hypothetical protein